MSSVPLGKVSAWSRVPEARHGHHDVHSHVERRCSELGLKMTGQRRTIARVLSEAKDHPDVEEVHRRALRIDRHISIATVYRTVRMFEERGIIQSRNFGGSRARFGAGGNDQQQFLIDVETGAVTGFDDARHTALVGEIAAALGFDLLSCRLELFGKLRKPTGKS